MSRGRRPDTTRAIVVAMAVFAVQWSHRRRARSSDVAHVLEQTWPGSGTWSTPRTNWALADAAAAGLIRRVEITPALFEWEVDPDAIDSILLTAHLERAQK